MLYKISDSSTRTCELSLSEESSLRTRFIEECEHVFETNDIGCEMATDQLSSTSAADWYVIQTCEHLSGSGHRFHDRLSGQRELPKEMCLGLHEKTVTGISSRADACKRI